MPIIETLSDLFAAGGSYVAEQFIRGRSKLGSLRDLLFRKFGQDLRAGDETIRQLQSRVVSASIPANAIMNRINVQPLSIPNWATEAPTGEFIHTGLARIDMVNAGNRPDFTTHIPFTIHEAEIMNYESILERINEAVEGGAGGDEDFYQAEIDRIQQLIRYHEIVGERAVVNPELYGVYRSSNG